MSGQGHTWLRGCDEPGNDGIPQTAVHRVLQEDRARLPPSLEQREWGFVLFNPGGAEMRMRRHVGFSGKEELDQYIRNLVPQHTYYSTAYYEKPDAGTMAEKGWCGADLIFDLDADHSCGAPTTRCWPGSRRRPRNSSRS